MDESELVKRAQSGDHDAFCELVRVHQHRIQRLAYSLCHDAAEAEDFSQEVWLRAFQSLGRFRAQCSFYAWARRILMNAFLNDRRDRAAEVGATPLEEARETSVVSRADELVLLARIEEALGELSPQERLVFLLRQREGMKLEEIAAELGCSAGTVKKALFRAVQKLRAKLAARPAPVRCSDA